MIDEFLTEMTKKQLIAIAQKRGYAIRDVVPFGNPQKRTSWLKLLQAAPKPKPTQKRGLDALPVVKTITYSYSK